jgi:DNA-binding IclR family transcriptional regulator
MRVIKVESKSSKKNKSIEKVLQIITIMAENRGPMRLQDIAEKSELPASTALRLIHTLVSNGFARQDPYNQQYSLSLKFAYIGSLVKSSIDLRNIARPYLIDLANRCNTSSCIAIEEKRNVLFIDVVESPSNDIKAVRHIGSYNPMYCTAIGKLFMLNFDNKQISEYVATNPLNPYTPRTITTKNDLINELERIRLKGYAINDEEQVLGLRCLAAPILDYNNRIVAGISITDTIFKITSENMEILADAVKSTAKKISKELAYTGNK